MALGRLSVLKSGSFLKITASTFDDDLMFELENATDFVNSWCDRVLEEASYSDEFYTPFTDNKLYLKQWPVTSVSAVKFWDSATETFITEASTLWELINGRFIAYPKRGQSSSSTFSRLPKNDPESMKISYLAGYPTSGWATKSITDGFAVPRGLEWGTCAIAAIDWSLGREDRDLLGIVTRSLGVESMSYESFEKGIYPEKIIRKLDTYKRLTKI